MNFITKLVVISLVAAEICAADMALTAPLEKPAITINAPAQSAEIELKRRVAAAKKVVVSKTEK